MSTTSAFRTTKKIGLAGLAIALLTAAVPAGAQDREERWEFTLGTFYQLGTDLDFDGGTTVNTDDDFGFAIGGAYNFTDRVAASIGFQWAGVGYDAEVIDEDGVANAISGTYDAFAMSANLIYNFTDGPLTPYVGAGIGWTFIDTNIPNGLPSTGCWWDPWYGYICYTNYPTKTTDAFSYQATLGLRYEFGNDRTFMKLGYTSQWVNLGNATGTPRFDVIGLDVGWIF